MVQIVARGAVLGAYFRIESTLSRNIETILEGIWFQPKRGEVELLCLDAFSIVVALNRHTLAVSVKYSKLIATFIRAISENLYLLPALFINLRSRNALHNLRCQSLDHCEVVVHRILTFCALLTLHRQGLAICHETLELGLAV